MDDEDRHHIQKYLFNIDETKSNNNQPIFISNYFNDTTNHVKTVVKNDSNIIDIIYYNGNKFYK